MKNPDLTVIILSYNVRKQLVDCLKSLYNSGAEENNWRIIVVDNASSDDSVKTAKKLFPRVKIMLNSDNLGFAAGNNVALKRVDTPYTLLLNPDTIVYPGTISTVLGYLKQHSDVAAATCRVELPDGSLDYSCHRGFPNPLNSFVYFFTNFKNKSSYKNQNIPDYIHEIDALTGAFAMVRTSAGKEINWLDEDYYWNGEDIDFCWRLKHEGWKIVYIPNVKITHYKGSSSGLYKHGNSKPSREVRIRSVRSGIKAMEIFYKKRLSANYPFVLNWLVFLGIKILGLYRELVIYLT